MSEHPTDISQDEQQSLAHFVKGVEMANSALNSYVQHLSQKYEIRPPDQLLAGGKIYRAPKQEPPQVGTRAVSRRAKFGNGKPAA